MFNDLELAAQGRHYTQNPVWQQLMEALKKKQDGVMHLGSGPNGEYSDELWQRDIDNYRSQLYR